MLADQLVPVDDEQADDMKPLVGEEGAVPVPAAPPTLRVRYRYDKNEPAQAAPRNVRRPGTVGGPPPAPKYLHAPARVKGALTGDPCGANRLFPVGRARRAGAPALREPVPA